MTVLINPPCPWLPSLSAVAHVSISNHCPTAKGLDFYEAALHNAQSYWLAGKPAQAVLQLNKAWAADLGKAPVLCGECAPPYAALVWIMKMAATGKCGFLGNPVRHFQHLASRMSGPRAEARAWRAWLCFHLAGKALLPTSFPRDGVQILREGLWIPSWQHACSRLEKHGWPGEAAGVFAAAEHTAPMDANMPCNGDLADGNCALGSAAWRSMMVKRC